MKSYEYTYVDMHGVTLEGLMEKLNEYGEEGYHLIHQDTFGIVLLEREVYSEMAEYIGEARVISRPIISDSLYITVMFFFIVILIVAVTARVYNWI